MTQQAQTTSSTNSGNSSKKAESPTAPAAAAPRGAARPEAFKAVGGDLVGYWEAPSPPKRKDWLADRNTPPVSIGSPAVLFTPLHVTLSDSKMKGESHRCSTLIHCRLEEECELRSADKEEGYKVFPKGSLFGIWSKPGMRDLNTLAETTVWMGPGGFKDTGSPSLMVAFDIQAGQKGQKLPIKEDRRKDSLPEALKAQRVEAEQEQGEDFIPF